MNIDDIAKEDFLSYSMEVIKDRAIPAIDGCKPIHRRILYVMYDEGILSNKPTRKCAKISGSVMGRVHPHGSSSVYDAMVRIAQPWKLRYPLIQMQGNMGTLQGDKAASERYTECRLTPLGEDMCKDLDKNCVPMELNYSNEEYIPLLLPSEFPHILCNPNLGIAVALSSTTAPHNLGEVVNTLIAYINDNNISIDKLIELIHAPDFPTGGTIINPDILPTIYKTGKGTIKLRCKYKIEQIGNKVNIIISEVPYLISIEDNIIKVLKKMVIEDNYKGIDSYQDNTGKDGFEIRITVSNNADIDKVLKDLFEKTALQSNISINNTILIDGKPKLLDLKSIVAEYIKFRHRTLINIFKFDKEKANKKSHILDGLLIALADIDNIITIIKSSSSRAEAKTKLIDRYNFSDEQVTAILDMKLSKLTSLETNDIKTELGELQKTIQQLTDLIGNTNNCRNIYLIEQLLKLKDKYNDERLTMIDYDIEKKEESVSKVELPKYKILLDNNTIVAIDEDKLEDSFKKGGVISKNKPIEWCYTNKPLNFINKQEAVVSINGTIPFIFDNSKQYVVTISTNGISKKTAMEEYKTVNRLCKLKNGDNLLFAGCCDENDSILLWLENDKMVSVLVKDIKSLSKLSIGTKTVAQIIKKAFIATEYFYTINKDNQLKRTNSNEIGTSAVLINASTSVGPVTDNDLLYDGTKLSIVDWQNVAVKGRTAIGAKISNKNFECKI